jgi:hypothetical protein
LATQGDLAGQAGDVEASRSASGLDDAFALVEHAGEKSPDGALAAVIGTRARYGSPSAGSAGLTSW